MSTEMDSLVLLS